MTLQGAHQDGVDVIHASHVDQYKDLLTGVMSDQPVAIANSVVVKSLTVKSSGPNTNILADGVTPTPAGVAYGKLWNWGGGEWNVMAGGAKGDGVTDDNVAIALANTQAAVAGGDVAFPQGVYPTTVQLTQSGGTRWKGTSLDYAGVGPLALPARGSIITAGAAINAVVKMGDDQAATTSGHTAPVLEDMIVDGANVATYAVRTFSRRCYIRKSQVYRATTTALQVDGQNTYVIDSVIGQDDRGISIDIANSDFHMFGTQVRGAGATFAVIHIENAGSSCQIGGNHIFANNSGGARELFFIFAPSGVNIYDNQLDGGAANLTVAFIRCAPSSGTALALRIQDNEFFVSGGTLTDNTIPFVSLDTTNGNISTVSVMGNVGVGGDATHRYSAIVAKAGSAAISNLILSGNNVYLCVTDVTGMTPAVRNNNVIHDGTNVLTPTDYPKKLDDQTFAGAASVTLTVPAGMTYTTLKVFFTALSDQATGQGVTGQFNGDTGNNYDAQIQTDVNTTLAGGGPFIGQPSGRMGSAAASGATAGARAACEITVMNADSTTLRKFWHYHDGRWDTDAAGGAVMALGQGQWRNTTNPVTSLKLTPAAGLITGRAILYGHP